MKDAPRRAPAVGPAGRGPPWMSLGTPAEKATRFWPSARRLLRRLRPQRLRLILVALLATSSVALSVLGPLLIGHATDIIFSGAVGEHLAGAASARQSLEPRTGCTSGIRMPVGARQ